MLRWMPISFCGSVEFEKNGTMTLKVLATDLDGTLIPLANNEKNKADLKSLPLELQRRNVLLMFVTGRSLELVREAMKAFSLPKPSWVICDVGTSIVRETSSGIFKPVDAYTSHLGELTECCPVAELKTRVHDLRGLRLQEPEKQGPFKLSFYAEGSALREQSEALRSRIAEDRLPYSLIASHDPETNEGLIDLLPTGVSKAYALNWWAGQQGYCKNDIVFAGDSGNDLAALTAGYRAIVVSNAHHSVTDEVQRVYAEADSTERLCRCEYPASSGVLEGLRYFSPRH